MQIFQFSFAQASSVSDEFEQNTCTEKGDANKFANMLSQWHATGQTNESCSQSSVKRKTAPLDEILVRTFKMQKIHEYLSQDAVPCEAEKFASYKSESDSDDDAANGKDKSTNSALNQSSHAAVSNANDHSPNKLTGFSDERTTGTTENDMKLPDRDYRIDCKVKAIDTPNRAFRQSMYTVSDDSITKTPSANDHLLQTTEKHDQSAEKADAYGAKALLDDEADTQSMSTSQPKKVTMISTTIAEIKRLMERETETEHELRTQERRNRIKFKAKIDPKLNKSAEHELETEIAKSDFVRMDVIGQFNLGFIIARLDQDVFIIDQHATDEKYNFETLQKQTVLQQQPLVVPQDLDLTAVNEIILMNNLPVFEANGFRFDIDANRPVTKRVKLMGKPFSKNWEFGKEDIDELIFMLQDGTSNTSYLATCRPSRVRAMFASRACRSSVS